MRQRARELVRQRARELAVTATALAALGVVGSVLLPLVPAWPFTLFEHFRFQYLWGGALVALACGGLRMRGWFDAALIATVLNAWWVLPDLSRRARPVPENGEPLRVLVLNVHTSNAAFAEVERLVADTRPDVVGLLEVNPRWLAELAPALTGYPHQITEPHEKGNFGIALYSKLPLTGQVEHLGSQLPTIAAKLDLRGTPLDIILTHPIPPIPAELYAMQLAQLDAVARRTRELGASTLVMGDFNATPWSRAFRDLVAATGLCDTRAGFGLQASYPAAAPAVLRIPIDHALVSCTIGVASRTIERHVGSDHLPVLLDLVVPRHEAK